MDNMLIQNNLINESFKVVIQKFIFITLATSRIALGLQDKFYLSNLDAKRDCGHAKEYIRVMWMILQTDEPEDWVIATGKRTTVRDFVLMSFDEVGIELEFNGMGVNEKAYVKSCKNPKF